MGQSNVDDLTDTTSSTAGIAAGQTNAASDVKTFLDEAATDIGNLNDAVQAIATNQSGATAPAWNRQGELFFDTDTSQLFVDPDGSGHDDELLSRLTAKLVDIATGGTATHKISGAIDVNTTDSARTTTGDFAQTYTLPANTLDANGKMVRVKWNGTRSGAAGTFSLQPILGTTNLGTALASVASDLTDWEIVLEIFRTGVGAQKFAWSAKLNKDSAAAVTLTDNGTAAEDETAALAIKLNLSAVSAGTVTQTIMRTELFN